MATPVKPVIHQGDTLTVGGVATEIVNDNNIGEWIEGLSPVGASQHDTGWVNVTIASGFARQGSFNPQVRRVGKIVYMRWGWANTGISSYNSAYTVGTIPSGYRPPQTMYVRLGTASAAQHAQGVIYSSGQVEVRTVQSASLGALPDYVLFDGISWLLD